MYRNSFECIVVIKTIKQRTDGCKKLRNATIYEGLARAIGAIERGKGAKSDWGEFGFCTILFSLYFCKHFNNK
jgi:hypothetical protein